MLLGDVTPETPDAPRLLLIKARVHVMTESGPALAIPYLGAVARRTGWHVRAVDTYLVRDEEQAVAEALLAFKPRVVGLSALTAESDSLFALAALVRKLAPEVTILAGGAHASAEPEQVAGHPAIDAAVIGEGEATLTEVLERIQAGEPWHDVPGLALKKPSYLTVSRTEARSAIQDLDALPLPAWDLTSADDYETRRGIAIVGTRRYMTLFTSRGCPYRCTYCHDIQGKRFRAHSTEYVLRMVDDLRQRHRVFSYDIVDDIFNFDSARMEAICDGFIERGDITFTLPNGIRADRMNVEQVRKIAAAGCQFAGVAIETVTPRLQKQIKKHVRFDKLGTVLDTFTECNVLTAGFFMLGFPTETEEELRATIDYAVDSKLHIAHFFVVTPFGSTELHQEVSTAFGPEATEVGGSGMFWRTRSNLSKVPEPEFQRLRRSAYIRFYCDPVRAFRIARAHPSKLEIARYIPILLRSSVVRAQDSETGKRVKAQMKRFASRLKASAQGGQSGFAAFALRRSVG